MSKKKSNPQSTRKLTVKQAAELAALAEMPDEKIDSRSVPEQRDWSGAKRGLFYRPIKKQLTLRLDADVVAWFKEHTARDEGYQTNINRALREHVERRERAAKRQ